MVLIQACERGQSLLTRHSGWQPSSYGFPRYSAMHSQMASPFRSRQFVLTPHGDGRQGLGGTETSTGPREFEKNQLKNDLVTKHQITKTE